MNDKLITSEAGQFTDEQRKLITDVLCRGANPTEIQFFMNVAERLKLDPFKRQIHAMKRKVDGKDVMQFMVSIEGLRSIAARCKTHDGKDAYAGNSKPIFTYKKDGSLDSAEVTVLRIVQGETRQFTAEVFYDECVQKKGLWDNQGGRNVKVGEEPNTFWKTRPRGQLGKCAEAAALRKGFPEETGGVYIEDELPNPEDVRHDLQEQSKPPTPQAEGMMVETEVLSPEDDVMPARHWSDLMIENAYNLITFPEGTQWAGKAVWEVARNKEFDKAFTDIPREDTVVRHALDARYFNNLRTRWTKKGYDEDKVTAALRKSGFLTAEGTLTEIPGETLLDLGAAINDLPKLES